MANDTPSSGIQGKTDLDKQLDQLMQMQAQREAHSQNPAASASAGVGDPRVTALVDQLAGNLVNNATAATSIQTAPAIPSAQENNGEEDTTIINYIIDGVEFKYFHPDTFGTAQHVGLLENRWFNLIDHRKATDIDTTDLARLEVLRGQAVTVKERVRAQITGLEINHDDVVVGHAERNFAEEPETEAEKNRVKSKRQSLQHLERHLDKCLAEADHFLDKAYQARGLERPRAPYHYPQPDAEPEVVTTPETPVAQTAVAEAAPATPEAAAAAPAPAAGSRPRTLSGWTATLLERAKARSFGPWRMQGNTTSSPSLWQRTGNLTSATLGMLNWRRFGDIRPPTVRVPTKSEVSTDTQKSVAQAEKGLAPVGGKSTLGVGVAPLPTFLILAAGAAGVGTGLYYGIYYGIPAAMATASWSLSSFLGGAGLGVASASTLWHTNAFPRLVNGAAGIFTKLWGAVKTAFNAIILRRPRPAVAMA